FLSLSFFFFQAEDGIRDFHVTGVQTCALPIYRQISFKIFSRITKGLVCIEDNRRFDPRTIGARYHSFISPVPVKSVLRIVSRVRSEERRVGKEGRSRVSPYH